MAEILQKLADAHVPQWLFVGLWAWFMFAVLQADDGEMEAFDKTVFIFGATAVVFGLLYWGGFFQ